MPTVTIPLTQGKFALIDEEDLPLVTPHKWHAIRNGARWYAVTFLPGQRKPTRMHRLLMAFPNSPVDHHNGNGLDNRRANLREATHSQNGANRLPRAVSGLMGVSWDTQKRRWHVTLAKNGKRVFGRYFSDRLEAARAYDEAARQYHGEFAVLNFPRKGERGTDGKIR